MTKQTKSIIESFDSTGNISLLPSIVIGMQEEDSVATALQFKNCFRQLRNLAAHEPSNLVSQIKDKTNIGSSKIVIVPLQEDSSTVVLDIVQFTAWMFDMYIKTKESGYLLFWRAFLKQIYGNPVSTCKSKECTKLLDMSVYGTNILGWFLNWQTVLWAVKCEPKVIASKDPYVVNMWQTNQKVFWRMAIPNMMSIVMMLFRSELDLSHIGNLEGYITLFKEREGA